MKLGLFLCFTQPRERCTPITEPLLQEKNTSLSQEFNKGESKSTAGAGWLDCWGKCYAVRQPKISAEKLSTDLAWFVEFSELLQAVIKN